MKIAFDAKRYFNNNRGLGNYSRDVLRLLNTYHPDNEYLLFTPKKNERFAIPASSHVITPETKPARLFPSLWRSYGCLNQILSEGADIYHGLSQELPYGIHRKPVKTLVTMHDAIFMRYPELYDKLYLKIFIKKNQYSAKAADRIIAISEQTKQDFVNYFNVDPAKIDVVYQGCNSIFRKKVTPEEKINVKKKYNLPNDFLLIVGAIEKRKNAEVIIKALHDGAIDFPLVIAGNRTRYVDELQNLIAGFKLESKVFFRHDITTPDLPALYACASIFVYPSVFEGFGIPILEALSCGTPVITSNGSCFPETGGDAAVYINNNNPEELSGAIKKILSDADLRQTMINKGYAHADKFTDDKIAANLMRVYTKL